MPEDIKSTEQASKQPAQEMNQAASQSEGAAPVADEERRPVLASASSLKKQKKHFNKTLLGLAVILLVLALCAIGYWIAETFKPAEEPAPTAAPSTTQTLIGKTASDVQSVTVHPADGAEYTLIKTVDTHEVPVTVVEGATPDPAATPTTTTTTTYSLDPMPEGGFKLDSSAAGSIFGRAASVTAQSIVAEAPSDTAQYGFDAPTAWYNVTYTDGSTARIILGNKSPATSYYLMVEGDPNVYAVYSSVATTINTPLTSLHTVSLPFAIDAATISNVTVERAGKDTIEIRQFTEDEVSVGINAFKMVQPFEYEADSENLSALNTNVAAIALTGYAGNMTAANTFGLDAPSSVITVTDANGTYAIRLGGKSEDGTYTYASIDDTAAVYTVQTSLVSFIDSLSEASLVDRFSNIVNIVNVDSLDITTADATYTLSIERVPEVDENGDPVLKENSDEQVINEVYYFNGTETESKAFKTLYQSIIGVLVNGLTDDYALTTPASVTVTYHLNLEAMPTFTVEYFDYDRDNMGVRRDGHTFFFVRKDKIAAMLTALSEYQA